MNELKIITNNHTRPVLFWYELTPKEKAEFDWLLTSSTLTPDDAEFVRYKWSVYCLSDIERANRDIFPGWDGYASDSFFSGILFKYHREEWGEIDTDHVIMGWYYS